MNFVFKHHTCSDTGVRTIRAFDVDGRTPIGKVEVGMDFSSKQPDRVAYLSDLRIEEEHRGKGMARPLMMEAEQTMWQLGFRAAVLTAAPEDLKVQEFYQRMGWKFQRRIGWLEALSFQASGPQMVYRKSLTAG